MLLSGVGHESRRRSRGRHPFHDAQPARKAAVDLFQADAGALRERLAAPAVFSTLRFVCAKAM